MLANSCAIAAHKSFPPEISARLADNQLALNAGWDTDMLRWRRAFSILQIPRALAAAERAAARRAVTGQEA
jgi:hypothetical protein